MQLHASRESASHSTPRNKIVGAGEAVCHPVQGGNTVATSGFVGVGFAEGIALALGTLAAATLATAAHCGAAAAAEVYGLIDVAAEHVTNVAPSGNGLNRIPSNTGTLPSRIGVRGGEDLGDGLRTVFVLEQGFAPDMGTFTQGGRAWGRQALVGFTSRQGSLSVGRQYTMLYWSILDADILGTNIYGSGSLDPYVPNARADNMIAYRGTFGGLTVGATYSFGRDSANANSPAGTNCPGESADAKECREWSALVKYDSPAWGAAAAVDEIRGGPGAFAGLTSSALKDTRVSVNGYANVTSELRLAAGLIWRDNEASLRTPRSNLWYAGALWAATPLIKIDGELFVLDYRNSADKATLLALRATYGLSKRTAVYATVGHIDNDGTLAISVSGGAPGSNPLPGAAQSGIAAGVRHIF
jgi:predicted porin